MTTNASEVGSGTLVAVTDPFADPPIISCTSPPHLYCATPGVAHWRTRLGCAFLILVRSPILFRRSERRRDGHV